MKIEDIIRQIDQLDPINPKIFKLLDILEDENHSLEDVTDIIEFDPNLTANILRYANSALFGAKMKIESLQAAVSRLGSQTVFEVVIGSIAASRLNKGLQGYDLKEGELWRHSVFSSLFAKELARRFDVEGINLVFTAALLKDIGKVILNRYLQEVVENINELIYYQKMSFIEAEKRVLGIDHAQLGGIVAQKWNFPKKLVQIIRHHHMEDASGDDPEVNAVYIADTICSMIGIGTGSDGLHYRFDDAVIKRFVGIDISLDRVIAELSFQIEEAKAFTNILSAHP
jgi:putative nucleotidyltransferase with HDIG domain